MSRKTTEGGIAGILRGLGDLVDTLSKLEREGVLKDAQGRTKGVYGINVKVGLGEQGPKVEPFGNWKRDENSGEAVVHELREPVADVFEESDHLLIVAEMPGVTEKHVHLEADGDLLTVAAEHKDRKYRKELHLPRAIDPAKASIAANNGVIEIRCPF